MANKDLIFTVLGIDRASNTFKDVGDSMDKMASRAVKALTGVTGASAASAAAVAAAVGGMPLLFTGLGAVALRENEAIKDSFSALSEEINTGLAADAAPLADDFVKAARDIGAGFQAMRPQLREAFEASQPAVETLTDSVLGFAEGAMPGMVDAVKASGPVLAGLESLAKDTGAGVGEMFEIMADSSDEAGQGVEHLGGLVRGTLPEVATILGDLTGLWAEHGDEVVDVVLRIMGVLSDLSGGALPVVGEALGVTLDVLGAVLDVIEPLAGELGHLVGVWLAFGTALKGMRAVQGILLGATSSMTSFGEATRKTASKQGISTFRAGLTGVMGILGGPWGLAIGAGIAALSLFGGETDDVSSSQRSLADALRESGGEFTAQAREIIATSPEYRAIADAVDAAGLSHSDFVDALIEGGPAYERLQAQLSRIIEEGTRYEWVGNTTRKTLTAQAEAATVLKGSTGGLRSMIRGATEEQRQETDAIDDATVALERKRQKLLAITDPMFGLINAVRNVDEAQRAYNKALREHGPRSREARREALRVAEAVADAEAAALNGEISFGKFSRKLDQWVRQGMLTERQARQIRGSVRGARREAERFQGNYGATVWVRDQATGEIRQVNRELAGLDRYVPITVDVVLAGTGPTEVNRLLSSTGRAHGGRTRVGQPTLVGEHHPEVFVPDVAGTILSPSQSATIARNVLGSMRGGGAASAAATQGGAQAPTVINYNFSFPNYIGSRDELMRTLRKQINDEGGNVQKVLGR